jgi:catecholate siderophore receptor
VPLGAGLTDAGEANYTVSAGAQRRWATNSYVANITDATLRFGTGRIEHTLVVGGEFAHEKVENTPLLISAFAEDAAGNPLPTPTAIVRNLLNPNPVLGYTIPVLPDTVTGPSRVVVNSLAGFAIDTIKISPKVWLTLGARIDSFKLDYRSNSLTTATLLKNDATFANWQASLVYKPVNSLTLYTSFATSSNPSGEQFDGNAADYGGITAATQNLAPERNKSWEAGVKWETADGKLLVTAAAFQIDKDNAREAIGGGVFDLVGKLRSRGIELGVNGTLWGRLQLFGGYTYNDAKIVESVTAANVGRRFANVPRHSANLLATWMVAGNFEFGGQIHYQSDLFGGTSVATTARLPGFTRLDAVVRWKPLPWLETRLNVNNVTNKTYYDAIYRSAAPFAYVAPGRSAVLTLAIKY